MFGLTSGKKYPVLPLRDIVVFPHMIVPLFVGREKSVKALEDVVLVQGKQVLLVTQKNAALDDPSTTDLYAFGTVGTVLQLLKLPDGTVKVLVEGLERVRITQFTDQGEYFEAYADPIDSKETRSEEEIEAIIRSVISQFEQYVKLNRKIPPDVLVTIHQIDDPEKLADTISSYLTLKITEKQRLLELNTASERLDQILTYIEAEISVMQVEKRIRTRVKRQMEKTQRDYYLNEQMKAIQKELGDGEEGKDEITEFEDKIKKIKLSKEAREKCTSELRKLKSMNPMSAEATVIRNYLDWMLNLPWHVRSRTKKDLIEAKKVLDRDHFALEKVKDRIIEYLAVQSRVGKVRGQILCLVGPPGVGKTSLGKSIAEATGRHFVRVALGGVRDEAEIRGHRRTYIGSMPGKVIQGIRKGKTSNPLFLFDEIDKMGSDWRGDPASALLEVLDPEQNSTFNDHYLEVDYDLSDVMFVTTANTLKMPEPLLDRMEIIRLPGYTEEEKLEITKRHLLPKQMEIHGLKAEEFSVDDAVILKLIQTYTREAGVRSLEREIANLARKAIKKILVDQEKSLTITLDNLIKFSGQPRFHYGRAEDENAIGAVTGLAWTEVGGDLLTIEAVVLSGKGKTLITGKLGDVMQESIQAAVSYIRFQATHLGIDPSIFEKRDIHIHVPEGAIPKDGPSAGVAMITSIVSALTGIPVNKDVAMTGEITLRGNVLPIGGLKEKLLAAHRGGIKTVIIPKENQKDIEEIPESVKRDVNIIPVSKISEVLKIALVGELTPIEWHPEMTDVSDMSVSQVELTSNSSPISTNHVVMD